MDENLIKELMTNSKKKTNNKTNNLFIVPKKDDDKKGEAPHFQSYLKNALHQTDLLYLPKDNGFEYCLVVVDCGPDHIMDAQPLREKTARAVLVGLKKLYARKILEPPFDLTVDAGAEFKGEFKDGISHMGIHLRTATAGRSNGLAYVEIETGKICRKRTSVLPTLVKLVNEYVITRKNQRKETDFPTGFNNFNTFKVGDKVRTALDKPIDYLTSKRLSGYKFRGSDIRWSPKIKVVREIILRPDEPMMYLVSDEDKPNILEPHAYTRNKLQHVN